MYSAHILVVDDEAVVRKGVKKILERKGHHVETAENGNAALDSLEQNGFDLIITDLKMPDMDGIQLLKIIKEKHADISIMMITGYSTVQSAVESMKLGAVDYIEKPFTPEDLTDRVNSALRKRITSGDYFRTKSIAKRKKFPYIIGESKKLKEVFDLIEKTAVTSATVLITGESGTGKELVAKAIHSCSKRADKKFIAVDCGVFTPELLADELFGHIKGSFTGAVSTKKGVFEIADGGTIFFDEIANMDLNTQTKLLRVLQEREFVPVGGTEPKKVNVRLITATNKNLKKLVAEDKFREDLFYRIYVVPINVPPLRERKEDIPLLAYHFVRKFSVEGEEPITISEGALNKMMNYEWPGNVRQLENMIQRAIILAEKNIIKPEHLPIVTQTGEAPEPIDSIPRTSEELKEVKKKYRHKAVEKIEKNFVTKALNDNDWNITKAAGAVGMQRPNFHALMRKYDIKKKND